VSGLNGPLLRVQATPTRQRVGAIWARQLLGRGGNACRAYRTRGFGPAIAGAGFEFDSRGQHELKGIDDTWQLLALKG
jgi:hypothetical protein